MPTIRQEIEADHDAVYSLIVNAFELAKHRDGTEQDLVVRLRQSLAFIPELSLVAIDDGQIVGYILLTKIKIGNSTELALAPLAVSPSHQG